MGMGMSVSPQIWQQFIDIQFQDDIIKRKQNFDVIITVKLSALMLMGMSEMAKVNIFLSLSWNYNSVYSNHM